MTRQPPPHYTEHLHHRRSAIRVSCLEPSATETKITPAAAPRLTAQRHCRLRHTAKHQPLLTADAQDMEDKRQQLSRPHQSASARSKTAAVHRLTSDPAASAPLRCTPAPPPLRDMHQRSCMHTDTAAAPRKRASSLELFATETRISHRQQPPADCSATLPPPPNCQTPAVHRPRSPASASNCTAAAPRYAPAVLHAH